MINSKSLIISKRLSSTAVSVSRLRENHRITINGGIPPVNLEQNKKLASRRELFGRFGLKSKVDVAELFPTVEELQEQEKLGLYRQLSAVRNEQTAQAAKEDARLKARRAELEKNLKKYPTVLKKYEDGLVKQEAEKDAKEVALEKRIREIQEYFGYWIDPKDPRFEVMLQQKEAEEKKAAKMAKRQEIQKKRFAENVNA